MTTSVYERIATRRTKWTPAYPVAAEYVDNNTVELLSKALTLRKLEIPVKEFIQDGLGRKEAVNLGQEGIDCLIRNTEDEERHDIALNNCVSVLANYDNKYEAEADAIVEAWVNHPDHPIVKAAVLENGLFFMILPLFRRFGSESLRSTSLDISSDEALHVQSHRYASIQLNYRPSETLDKLRKLTVDWIVSGFSYAGITADSLRTASDKLMKSGRADELAFSQSTTSHAFFEKRNDQLPYYN